MGEVVREIEGSWEEVRAQDAFLAGKRVRLQVFRESPSDVANDLRRLLKETQARAQPVTEEEIEAEVQAARAERKCAS
jgi:hypothetical protein